MAKPIKNTPILTGEDARRFREEINHLPSLEERALAREKVKRGAQRLRQMIAELPC